MGITNTDTLYEVNVTELIIADGEANKSIYGMLYKPQGEGRFPAVILSHGYNSSHACYENECRFLAEHGCICYAYDFCGGSTHSKSSGSSADMTVFTERENLLEVFRYICEIPQVDAKRVFLLGSSQGGFVTALAAEELTDAVRGVVLYFPAINIPDDWRRRYPDPENAPEAFDFWDLRLGRGFVESIHNFYPFEVIGKYKGGVIIFQGNQDDIVPQEIAQRAADLYENSQLTVFDGEGHGFSPEVNKICMERVLAFLRCE